MVLPVLVNLDGNTSLHSCDQCNQRRRRCDRKAPSCSQCTFREVDCSYNRQLKRCQVLARTSGYVSSTLSPPSQTDSQLIIIPFDTPMLSQPARKPKKPNRHPMLLIWGNSVLDRGKPVNALTIQKMASNWPYTMSEFIEFLKGGISSRFPPIYIAKPCLAPCLPVNKLWLNTPDSIMFPINIMTYYDPYHLPNLLDSAVIRYFEVVNPFNPLFIYRLFYRLKRSELLILAICLSGLHHHENKSSVQLELMKQLGTRIQYLARLSKLKFSFDTLQFILVVLVGFRGISCMTSLTRLCQSLLIRLAHGLGTHIDNLNQFKTQLSLERRLAYNLAATTDANRGWGLKLPYLRSVDHNHPTNPSYNLINSFHNIYHLNQDQVRSKNQIMGLGWDLSSLYFSSYYFETINRIFDLHNLYNRVINGSVSISEVKSLVSVYQKDSLEICQKCQNQLYLTQSKYDLSDDSDSATKCYVNGSLMFVRVLCYANASLVTMAESHPQLGQRKPNDPILIASTRIVLDWACQVITASLQLPTNIPIFEGRVFLSTTALSFIIRHLHLHSNPIHLEHTVYLGYSHLLSLRKFPGLRHHVQENLQILNQLAHHLHRSSILKHI